jgi:hypothetical protein
MVANVDLLLKEPVQIYLLLAVLGIDRSNIELNDLRGDRLVFFQVG